MKPAKRPAIRERKKCSFKWAGRLLGRPCSNNTKCSNKAEKLPATTQAKVMSKARWARNLDRVSKFAITAAKVERPRIHQVNGILLLHGGGVHFWRWGSTLACECLSRRSPDQRTLPGQDRIKVGLEVKFHIRKSNMMNTVVVEYPLLSPGGPVISCIFAH